MAKQMVQQPEGDILNAVQSGDIMAVIWFLDEGLPVDLTDEEGRSLLHHAAALGQVKVINLLCENGCRVDLIDNEGRTPLHYAATNGDIETIRILIAMGSNVNSVDNERNTPLKWSVMCEQNTAIEELTKHGGTVEIEEMEPSADNLDRPALLFPFQVPGQILGDNIEVCRSNQNDLTTDIQQVSTAVKSNDSYKHSDHHSLQTDLVKTQQCMDTNADTTQLEGDIFEAAQCGDTTIVKGYLDLGGPVDLTDKDGRTLLHCAAGEGQVKVVELLIKRGCCINPVDKNEYTPLDYATACGHVQTVQLLKQQFKEPLEEQNFIDHVDNRGRSVLYYAAASGDNYLIESILLGEQVLDVNISDDEGWTPLHYAAAYGQCQSVLTLLRLGGRESMTKVAVNAGTPLHQAVAGGHKDIVSLLLNAFCPIDVVDSEGASVLHYAAHYGQIHMIEMLADKGLDVNIDDDEGKTPLHYAATCGQLESVRTLLGLGGRESMTKVAGRAGTPLYQAVGKGHKDVVSLLLNEGCPINAVGSEGRSIVDYAAGYGRIDMVDNEGRTPLHYAAKNGDIETIRLLIAMGSNVNSVDNEGLINNSLQSDLVITPQCMDTNADTNQLEGDIFEVAQCGDTATVKGYLDLGVPVDVTDEDGWSPVHHALAHRQVEVIRLLMDRGCLMNPVKNRKQATKSSDVHNTTEGGSKYSPSDTKQLYEDAFEAARCGDTATIQSYLNSGGPVDLNDEDGRTLLHCAAGEGQIKVVELLIKRGCRIDPVDRNGCTPLDYATACSHLQTVPLLKQQLNEPWEEQYVVDSVDSQGRSALHFAAAFGDINLIEMLVKQGLDVNIGDDEGWTPLHNAANRGQLESVRTLLRLGGRESMTKVAATSGTPLHQAVVKGHKDIVSLLLNEGCPISVMDSQGRSVLHHAAQHGQIHMIEMLQEKGLDVKIDDDEGCTPLHYAAAYGQLESVRTLLQLGGRMSMTKVTDNYGTPLHQAVERGNKDIVSLLLNEGCPINVVDSGGRSVLHYAARYGQIHIIEMLGKKGLNINIGDDEGKTPLHYAAAWGQLESVRTLLGLGGRESMTKVAAGIGRTPLHQAVGKGHKDIVLLLLNEGCPINVVDSEGTSVLHIAAGCGQIHMIEMLAERGLDVNRSDNEGWTSLHSAAAYGQLESVHALLRLGGRESIFKIVGTRGTPLHQAVANGHKDIVSLLLKEGCPINVVDSEGKSVLHIAAGCGQINMIKMLEEMGLDVNIDDNKGCTPLHAAAVCGQLESVHTLLRLGGRESMTKVACTSGTPLHRAVAKGHKDIVFLLLEEGCPINVVDSEGASVLNYAAQYGQIQMIEMLSDQELDVNIGDNKGCTPLHTAAAFGQTNAVCTLLRLGGSESMMKVSDTYGTPLHQAVAKGHKDVIFSLLATGCPYNVVDSKGMTLFHWTAVHDHSELIESLAKQGLDVNIGDNEDRTSLHYAAVEGHVTTFKELVGVGGNIHLMDKFGMKSSDYILIMQNFVTVKNFCVACGLECDEEGVLGVISALSANNLLDINKILCLAAVSGDVSIFDAMITSPYPLNQQKMPKIAICLSSASLSLESGGKKLPDQFHVSDEPLNPLHISILSEYFTFSQNIKFIEKLTSHSCTRYTVNELFPNGLSPLDVARRFELHDIAVIIEKAGGGPGAWADLPKEIEDKAIDLLMSLKELRGRELGEDVTSRIVSLLGYPLGSSDRQEVKKILEAKPKRSLMQKHVLTSLKYKKKWESVGDLLEVDEDILENISEEATDDDSAYRSMLKHWLKHGRNVSWKTLLDAVGHFETKKTVDDITDKILQDLAPSQERSIATSFSSQLLIQSGPTLDRPLQLIDTLGGQSTPSSSDPLTSTSETHPFDVFEQLLESFPDPQCGAIIEKYKDRFLASVDAHAIVTRLKIEKVIPDTVSLKIQQSAPSVANEVLFLHLQSHSSPGTLHKLCDVMINMRGYPKMNELGRFMTDNLITCGASTENYKDICLSYIDASAIVTRLEIEKVIPDTVSHKIQQSAPSVANEVLFLHLQSHSSPETLHKLCDVMISTSGYPMMNELGQYMKDKLTTKIPGKPITDQ